MDDIKENDLKLFQKLHIENCQIALEEKFTALKNIITKNSIRRN